MLGSMPSISTPFPGPVWDMMPSLLPWTATSNQVIGFYTSHHHVALDCIASYFLYHILTLTRSDTATSSRHV